MPSYPLTIALGTNEEGEARRQAWTKAAENEMGAGRGAINRWIKRHLDRIAGFHWPK
jgi:hypothetical protein